MEANGFAKFLAGTMGYNPNTHELPIFCYALYLVMPIFWQG
jgi:hypothetical protein